MPYRWTNPEKTILRDEETGWFYQAPHEAPILREIADKGETIKPYIPPPPPPEPTPLTPEQKLDALGLTKEDLLQLLGLG